MNNVYEIISIYLTSNYFKYKTKSKDGGKEKVKDMSWNQGSTDA